MRAESNRVELAAGVAALAIGDDCKWDLFVQFFEHLTDVPVGGDVSSGHAAIRFSEERRQLGQLLRGQGAGVVGHVVFDDGSPDFDCIELRILLGTVRLLAFHETQVGPRWRESGGCLVSAGTHRHPLWQAICHAWLVGYRIRLRLNALLITLM